MPASRRIGAAVLVVMASALAACAGSAPAATRSGDELAGTLTVYAAASLTEAFDEITAVFEGAHPAVTVVAVYDGSSTLVTQITEGAPADVFASADEASMNKAENAAIDPHLFATNTLVLAVPAGNPAAIETLRDLAGATVVLCAQEVPCGAASATLLENAGVSVTPASLEQNVAAVLTKVAAGEADAGLVYATDVVGDDAVDVIVPEGAEEVVNRYPITVLAGAKNPDAASAYVTLVRSEAGQEILADFGFGAP